MKQALDPTTTETTAVLHLSIQTSKRAEAVCKEVSWKTCAVHQNPGQLRMQHRYHLEQPVPQLLHTALADKHTQTPLPSRIEGCFCWTSASGAIGAHARELDLSGSHLASPLNLSEAKAEARPALAEVGTRPWRRKSYVPAAQLTSGSSPATLGSGFT